MCGACYTYLRRHGTTDRAPRELPRGKCQASDDCTEIVYAVKYGLCHYHYERYRATGDVRADVPKRIYGDDAARFWSYVEVRGPDECHPWTGAATKGRGYFYAGGKLYRATRYLLGVIDGVDIDGLDVCHTCDDPNCMNRKHLFPGTRLVNVQDMMAKGRHVKARAKVTPQFVRDVRLLYDDAGRTCADLARTFGINYHTMYDIVKRHGWKDVV